jgi:MoaD family protein
MAIEVRIPTPLRKYTAQLEAVEVDGDNVGAALDALTDAHPELKSRIFTDDGKVRRFVNIFANDEDIRFQDNLETPLEDGDTLSIVPAIAGGSA